MGIQSSLFLFPSLFSLNTSIFEAFPVRLGRICFRSIRVRFGQHTAVWFALALIFLFGKAKGKWRCEVMLY